MCSGHSQLLLLLLLTLLLLTLLLLLLVVVVVVLLLLLLLLRRVAIGALKGSRHCTLQRQIDSHGCVVYSRSSPAQHPGRYELMHSWYVHCNVC